MTSYSWCWASWIALYVTINLMVASVVVECSSASRSSTSLHSTINGGSNLMRTSDNGTSQHIEDNQSLFLSGNQCSNSSDVGDTEDGLVLVRKRDGSKEPLEEKKILRRLENLAESFSPEDSNTLRKRLNLASLAKTIIQGMYPNVTTFEIDTLAAETAASMATQHVLYARLAARILISQNHKHTPPTFSASIQALNGETKYIDPDLVDLVERRGAEINAQIRRERDYEMTYFGFKTLERSYLLRTDDGTILETPQYLMMRVALGIHCTSGARKDTSMLLQTEDERLQAAFETYHLMSQGYFTHASPTLFHSGTTHPQLSSCFLVQMSDDSIAGIYDTLKRCAVISKAAGGIGLSVHNIRARGTPIQGTRGISNGLVPMLRVYDVTSRYVDQGGGKRPGAFAVYLEPWHADVIDVLNLKKNHGKEEHRARDLFYGLWIPDEFMRRVEKDEVWSLMCPHQCPGLSECHGKAFDELYSKYEREGRFVRQMRARDLWSAILESQIETGTPYMLFKDSANEKSNQKNLGTIQCSNLCTEIIQFTDEEEIAVCNLASICLPKFVVSDRGPFGSINPDSGRAYFDHEALHRITKTVTKNLNRIIDINSYPVPGAKASNHRHRPIGIGVSGLADAFIRLGLPFTSDRAKKLNEAIFETMYHAALEASSELAAEHGSYETFVDSPASKGDLQFDLWGVPSHTLPSQRQDIGIPSLERYSEQCQGRGYDWDGLKKKIVTTGLRNSLLLAPMPTASTSQILGVNECFEPFSSNMYLRRVKAGEFILTNPHLLQDLTDRGLWTPEIRNQLMRDGGSVANIDAIPSRLKELYKTVWEIKMKSIIDMAADRGKFIDQSQSLNLFIADPTMDKLTAMHFYAWKKGLKTGMYYLRTKPAVQAIQYTVDRVPTPVTSSVQIIDETEVCINCQS
ncbi:ribonucleoside-diphosphate reductase [Nitzschia inconspicua]|uniref:Ribonucleoside-diphosphate reductase n=1 Tax=Nitzschia inconspicua TaxID=303405 RepID=A0A9K3PUH1_9STRA|nr:ribonucleoside-diphosphate reductase [Nitzschia inconspicua]